MRAWPGALTQRHVEELFPFGGALQLVKVRGRDLQKVVSHAVEDWTGNGRWLQVSGFAYRHDPTKTEASDLTLLTPAGPRRVQPDEEILLVTSKFLAGGGDGYSWGEGQMIKESAPQDLKELVIAELKQTKEQGISPEVEGRICNTERAGGLCLAGAAE